ncbi:MAG TPA: hypothetical protein IAA01_10595, partial [Candidatus Fournierella excrementavium]|nr:hypothetical protein [Candidatus Fournierella excrementavium]
QKNGLFRPCGFQDSRRALTGAKEKNGGKAPAARQTIPSISKSCEKWDKKLRNSKKIPELCLLMTKSPLKTAGRAPRRFLPAADPAL